MDVAQGKPQAPASELFSPRASPGVALMFSAVGTAQGTPNSGGMGLDVEALQKACSNPEELPGKERKRPNGSHKLQDRSPWKICRLTRDVYRPASLQATARLSTWHFLALGVQVVTFLLDVAIQSLLWVLTPPPPPHSKTAKHSAAASSDLAMSISPRGCG